VDADSLVVRLAVSGWSAGRDEVMFSGVGW
jgi:hypothetical protein